MQEWFSALILTSKSIKKVPSSLGCISVDWIPVVSILDLAYSNVLEFSLTRSNPDRNIAVKIMLEIIHSSNNASGCKVYHLVNPVSIPWESLLPTIRKYFEAGVVSLKDWIDFLEASQSIMIDDFVDKLALKLVDFFRGLLNDQNNFKPLYEVTQSQNASSTMRNLSPIDDKLLDNRMQQWGFSRTD